MIKNIATFYRELSLESELKDNLLSVVFALHPDLDIASRESYFEKINSYYSRYTIADRPAADTITRGEENELDVWLNTDLRIKRLRLQSVRGIPKSDVPFGIDFSKNGLPQSMIIYGSNGVGKSSIYNALEFAFCQKIGEAQLRSPTQLSFNDNAYKDYLRHFNEPFEQSVCEIELTNKAFSLGKINIPPEVQNKINPNSHFISDYDIYSNGQLDFQGSSSYSFQNLIARSIGLSDLLQKEKQLNAFANYARRTETTRINNLSREIDSDSKLIATNEEAIALKRKEIEEIERNKPQPANRDAIDFATLFQKIKQHALGFPLDTFQVKSDSIKYKEAYQDFTNQSIKTRGLDEIQFLNIGLGLLESQDSCPFCDNSKNSKTEITANVKNRIKEIEKLNKLSADLNKAATYFVENSQRTVAALNKNRISVSKIIEITSAQTELNDLNTTCHRLLSSLNNLVSEDLFAAITTLDGNVSFSQNRFGFINTLITANDTLINSIDDVAAKLISDFEKIDIEIAAIENHLTVQTPTESIGRAAILNSEVSTLEKQISAAKSNLERSSKELNNLQKQVELFQKIQNETVAYTKHFHNKLSIEINNAFEPIKSLVKEILDDYLMEEDRDVELEIKLEEEFDTDTGEVLSKIIKAEVVKKNDASRRLSVNKYFNTFHYRLFCTMVGISIAIASRRITGINMPLVLDDIFYASDLEHKATIERFLKKLFGVFQKHTPEKDLQLILFTHDQSIFESAITASSENAIEDIQFARLFPHSEAHVVDNYRDLVYILPTYLPRQLTQKKYSEYNVVNN